MYTAIYTGMSTLERPVSLAHKLVNSWICEIVIRLVVLMKQRLVNRRWVLAAFPIIGPLLIGNRRTGPGPIKHTKGLLYSFNKDRRRGTYHKI
jgi:hypothetical protein